MTDTTAPSDRLFVMRGDEKGLLDALTSPVEQNRIMGRAIAAGLMDVLHSWLMAESERGTDGVMLLAVVASIQVGGFASLAGSTLAPTGCAVAQALFVQTVEKNFRASFEAAYKYRMEHAGGQ